MQGTIDIHPRFFDLMLPELEAKGALTSDDCFKVEFILIVEGVKSAVNLLMQILKNKEPVGNPRTQGIIPPGPPKK